MAAAIYAAVVVVPRLERYVGRLADAWRRVRLGDHAALGDPEKDAYFDGLTVSCASRQSVVIVISDILPVATSVERGEG
ncbi:hypothetical protein [Pseudonocardia sp. NPDC049154]|uniref:hypothetical protein n=1 Tax=Pseudonocardia sp. NPDC049154 TaxID=3155501 RepID=UPI0033EB7DE3